MTILVSCNTYVIEVMLSIMHVMAVVVSIMHVVHAGGACSRQVCVRLPGGAGPSLPCDEGFAGS